MWAGPLLAGVFPPGACRPAVGVVHDGDEGIEQAWVVAVAVERAEAREQLLSILAAQVVERVDAEPLEDAGDRRPDVRDRCQVAGHTAVIAPARARVLYETASRARPEARPRAGGFRLRRAG